MAEVLLPPRWVAWVRLRPGGDWTEVARGETLEVVAAELHRHADRHNLPAHDRFLTNGRYPEISRPRGAC